MCGIAGYVRKDGAPPDPAVLRNMAYAMRRRGPDGEGFFTSGGLGLAHRRLSVIDLKNGAQPMLAGNGAFAVVFNGEIFNYRELRRELEGKGVRFRTDSDTEVLLELCRLEGENALRKLNGFFAFAFYDRAAQTLLLARDRLGVKPLFWFRTGDCFAFASSLNALKAHPSFPRGTDFSALSEYLAFQYFPDHKTIFPGVVRLPPASCLKISLAGLETVQRTYWTPEQSVVPFAGTYGEAQEELRSLMNDAVERRLIADVPLGVFLSGGLDSAVVAALAARKCGTGLDCFSISFPEKAYDESALAGETARFIRDTAGVPVRFHCREADPRDLEALRFLIEENGEPFADASLLPTCLLSRFARESVTVALSGDGADELFGGYERYRVMGLCGKLPVPPHAAARAAELLPSGGERSFSGRAKRFLQTLSLPEDERYRFLMTHGADRISARVLKEPLPPGSWSYEPCTEDPARRWAELDLHTYLPDDVLRKVDLASMAESLEVRSPFLDHRVAEFSMTIPPDWKMRGGRRKRIIGDAFGAFLPPDLGARRKRGFGVPLADWFRTCWNGPLREHLFSGRLDDLFLRAELEKLVKEHETGAFDRSYYLFSLLILAFHLEAQGTAAVP